MKSRIDKRPMIWTSALLLGLITLTILAPHSHAKNNWTKVDNFESHKLSHWHKADTRNDTDPKIESPQITERRQEKNKKNSYLIKKPAAEGVVGNRKALTYKKLPEAVEVGDTFTFYTRINVEYFPNNHVFGLSNLKPKDIEIHDYNAFEPSLRVTDKHESDGTKNDGTLMVKTAKGYSKIINFEKDRFATPLVPGTWYEIWYVVNNSKSAAGGQVYDVHIKGGNEFLEQTLVYKNASFRMSREKALIYFLANCNTGPKDKPYGNGGLKYDDIYMSKGINLTPPI